MCSLSNQSVQYQSRKTTIRVDKRVTRIQEEILGGGNRIVSKLSHIKARRKAPNTRTPLIPVFIVPPLFPPLLPLPLLPLGPGPDPVLVLLELEVEDEDGEGRLIFAVLAASWKEAAV